MNTLHFTVYGHPVPKGSKQSFVPTDRNGEPYRKNGRIIVNTTDANAAALKAWEAQVRSAASAAYQGRPFDDVALAVGIVFFYQRPKAHHRSGKFSHLLKHSAPRWNISGSNRVGDLDKLTRAVLDGMEGVVYRNDRQVCRFSELDQAHRSNKLNT